MILDDITSGGKIRDEFLDPDPGNYWETTKPFFEVPAWWRKFIFRVLTPREYVVYCYIVSYCGKVKVARPLVRHIMADLDVANSNTIHSAIKTLVSRGFLIKRRMNIRTRLSNVYKRPSLEYTLVTLLRSKLIDGNLKPIGGNPNSSKRDNFQRAFRPVSEGLRTLLGDDRHAAWLATPDVNKATMLTTLLEDRLSDRYQDFEAKQLTRQATSSADSAAMVQSHDRDHPQYDFYYTPDGRPRLIPGDPSFDDVLPSEEELLEQPSPSSGELVDESIPF